MQMAIKLNHRPSTIYVPNLFCLLNSKYDYVKKKKKKNQGILWCRFAREINCIRHFNLPVLHCWCKYLKLFINNGFPHPQWIIILRSTTTVDICSTSCTGKYHQAALIKIYQTFRLPTKGMVSTIIDKLFNNILI